MSEQPNPKPIHGDVWPAEWTADWCSYCDAGIGEKCRNMHGSKPLRWPHPERIVVRREHVRIRHAWAAIRSGDV